MVRHLTQKRVWFAEALISVAASELQWLIAQVKEWSRSLNKAIGL